MGNAALARAEREANDDMVDTSQERVLCYTNHDVD